MSEVEIDLTDEERLDRSAVRWRTYGHKKLKARDALIAAMVEASRNGLRDTDIARATKVHRVQVRRWLGKSR